MAQDNETEDDGRWEMSTTAPSGLDPFTLRFAELLDGSSKSQREIARAMGYKHPNILSMFKAGTTRVPLDKLARFAFVLSADESDLVRLWLATYMPAALEVLERAFGGPLSPVERSWLDGLRAVFGQALPPFDEDARSMLAILAKRQVRPDNLDA
jgi:transcriptional regulator with XRE-family HTH domain